MLYILLVCVVLFNITMLFRYCIDFHYNWLNQRPKYVRSDTEVATETDIAVNFPDHTEEQKGTMRSKLKTLVGPEVGADDPDLIRLIRRELIDDPRPFLTKLSLPLYQTPQAKVVDKVFKGKVGNKKVLLIVFLLL